MNDQPTRSARLRYTATGALAALAVVGAIAGTAALGAKPPTKPAAQAAQPTKPAADASQPDPSQLFLGDVQRLVNAGTISAAEGRVLSGEIQAGGVDEQALAAGGFTPAQLQAVQQTLSSTKESLAAGVPRPSK